MGDSPSTSESFSRQWYPARPTLEAHGDAIMAQARQHERGVLLSKETHRRLCSIDEAVARIEHSQDELALRFAQHLQDLKLEQAEKKRGTALKQALISGGCSVVVALVTLAGVYVTRPAPEPPRKLDPQTLEAIRLYEQRNGYRLGQRPPGGGEPEPFVPPKKGTDQ